MNIENRNAEEEEKSINKLIRLEKIRILFDNIIEKIAISLDEQKKKNTVTQDEMLFLEQLYCLMDVIQQDFSEFLQTAEKFNIKLSKPAPLLDQIYKKVNREISEQDRNDYLLYFHEKFKTNEDEDNDSQWTDNKSILSDVIIADDQLAEELDRDTDSDISDFKDQEGQEKAEEFVEEDQSTDQFRYHKNFVAKVHFNSAGNQFLSGGGDDLALLWEVPKSEEILPEMEEKKEDNDQYDLCEKNTPLHIFPKGNETIDFVSYSKDETFIALGSLDGTINVFYAQQGNYALKCKLEGPTEEIRWHSKANVLVAGSADFSCWMWNINKGGEVMTSFFGHENKITCGGFSPDGKIVITGSEDKSIRVWKPSTGECTKKISGYGFHDTIVTCLDFHSTQHIVLSGSDDSTACISNYETGKVLNRTQPDAEHSVESVLFTPMVDLFAVGSQGETIKLYDIQKFQLKTKFQLLGGVTKMKFAPNSNILVSSTSKGRIYMCDFRQPDSLKFQKGGGACILDFDVNQNQQVIASYDDGQIRLFDLKRF